MDRCPTSTVDHPTAVRTAGPAARRCDLAAQPSLEHRYYVCSDAGWLSLPGRGDGLVQPFRAQLGTLQHDGDWLLPGGARSRVSFRPARDLELRSGFAVHLGRFSGAAEEAQHLDQHGWTRSRARQRFHRAPVALVEVRVDIPRRLQQRGGSLAGAGTLLPLLQPPAPAPGARLPHAGRLVPATVNKEKSVVMMGGLAPQTPQDLALFRPEWIILFFADSRSCLTGEGLDRRIGQRR